MIGYGHIKERRLAQPVRCHPGTTVGQYVPFYFCPRSPMLYVISQKSGELTYRGGQDEVLHLVSTVGNAVRALGQRPIAFSDGNAATAFSQFSSNLAELETMIDWRAVNATYWAEPAVKERKQAEFLVFESFPWSAVIGIGVKSEVVKAKVEKILAATTEETSVQVLPKWYY